MITLAVSPKLELRPNQAEAIDEVNDAYESEGFTRPLVALPTVTGRTVIFAYLLTQRGADDPWSWPIGMS
jgi:superfamily II DNA or RNA helicase